MEAKTNENRNDLSGKTQIDVLLSFPISIDDKEIKSLTLRRPKVKDDLFANRYTGQVFEREAALVANLCSCTVAQVNELDMLDFKKLQNAYIEFSVSKISEVVPCNKREVEVTLDYPILINGIETKAGTIRRPKVSDVTSSEEACDDNAGMETMLVANLCGMSTGDVEELYFHDYKNIRAVYDNFLSPAPVK